MSDLGSSTLPYNPCNNSHRIYTNSNYVIYMSKYFFIISYSFGCHALRP